MRERPILFSAPMVRAILDGTKTQTRRVVKRIPWRAGVNLDFSQARPFHNAGEWRIAGSEEMTSGFRCPYGQPGDRLWVRETWGVLFNDEVADVENEPTWYRATDDEPGQVTPTRWRPSIHMPRARSRITLEVTGVRVERLQDISEAAAAAEGVPTIHADPYTALDTSPHRIARARFRDLWESINGTESWNSNPWVWVVEFKRAEAGHA